MVWHDEGFFSAKDNLRLYWESRVPDAPRAHLAVVHGYGDHLGRYRRFVEQAVKEGFAVHAFDYRGHGQADGRRSYCDAFSDYLDDLHLFWERVRKSAGGAKTFLLGHSNGGLMSVLYCARKPEGLSGLILSAPYLKVGFDPPALKVIGAKIAGMILPWLPVKNEITPEWLSRDVEFQKETDKDPLYNRVVTPRWYSEVGKAQVEALKLGPSITQPTYVFCGSKDRVASPQVTREFFESLGAPDKKFREYPDMLHEPLMESGKEEVWRDVTSWISAHL